MSGVVSHAITNLFGGVSQQNSRLRFENQVAEQINAVSSITDGLVKRPGTEFVGTVFKGSRASNCFTHAIDRDEIEQYVVTIGQDGEITVVDTLNDRLVDVNYESDAVKTYLSTPFPNYHLTAATVADFTFIANRTKTVVPQSKAPKTKNDPVFVVIRNGIAEQTYTVFIDGRSFVYETGDSLQVDTYKVTTIASNLANQIKATGFFNVRIFGGTFIVEAKDGHDLSFGVTDTWSDQAMYAGKGKVQSFEDLPIRFPEGLVLEIEGVDGKGGYYVQYEAGNSGAGVEFRYEEYKAPLADVIASRRGISHLYDFGFTAVIRSESFFTLGEEFVADAEFSSKYCRAGYKLAYRLEQKLAPVSNRGPRVPFGYTPPAPPEVQLVGVPYCKLIDESAVGLDNSVFYGSETGTWKEIADPYATPGFKAETAPIALVREADGSFLAKFINYEPRRVGDDSSVPLPSFVNNRIKDIAFYRNRLCFITADAVSCSQADDYFNFFPNSADEVLATDNIDLSVNHTKPSALAWAVTFNERLVLFGDNVQFSLSANGAFTPETAQLQPLSDYACDTRIKPVVAGVDLYFASKRGEKTQIWRYSVQPGLAVPAALDITAHVPTYLPKLEKLVWDGVSQTLFAIADFGFDLYLYRTYNDGAKDALQSWSKFQFAKGLPRSAALINSQLYITLERTREGIKQLDLERLDFSLDFEMYKNAPHLDMRKSTPAFYESGTNSTLFLAPIESVLADVKKYAFFADGSYVELNKDEGRIVVSAVTTAEPFTQLNTSFQGYSAPGNWTNRGAVSIGNAINFNVLLSPIFMREVDQSAMIGAQLKLRTMTFVVKNSGEFTVEITPVARPTKTFKFNPARVSSSTSLLNRPHVASSEFRTQVLSDGETTLIRLRSDVPTPLKLEQVVWEAIFTLRSRRI